MWKRIDVVLVILVLGVVTALFTFNRLMDIPDISFMSSAQRPTNVGDRQTPVATLSVERVRLTEVGSLSKNQAWQSIVSFLGGRSLPAAYELKEYDLQWLVSVEDASLAPVMADVFVPIGDRDQVFPVIVYGPGSTGLADRCAPSREDLRIGNMGNYRNQMIAQASQGYIVVMPNYEGLDNPDRNPHYFNKDSEARTLLSAAQATLMSATQTGLPLQPQALFFGGYSQGGHAAFSAVDYAPTYTPNLHISGVFGHGPTTNTTELLKSNPNLAAYFVQSYSEYYPAIKPEVMLEPAWIALLEQAKKICVNEGFGNNSATVSDVFTDPFETALVNQSLSSNFPEIYAVLQENNSGTSYTAIPTLIVQGLADTIVTTRNQNEFVKLLCQRNVPVQYQRYQGMNHFFTRQTSFRDTNAWIDTLSRGESIIDTCGEF